MLLQQCLAEGLDHLQATEKANFLADEQSKRVLERVASRLRAGKLFAGGMPLEQFRATDELPQQARLQGSAEEAAHAFMNRGRLLDLDEDSRRQRIIDRDIFTDHEEAGRQARAANIARWQHALAEAESNLASAPKHLRHKFEREVAQIRGYLAAFNVGKIIAASHGFQYATSQYFTAGVHFVSDTIKLVPVMTTTTVDTERDAKDQVSDFTTLGEADGSGYSSGGTTLSNKAVNVDDANDRAECDADDATRSAFGACSAPIQGELVIKHVTSLNSSLPLHFLEYATNKTPDGSDMVVVINAEGYIQGTS